MGYDLLLIVSIESYSWRLPIHVTSRKLYHTKETMEHQQWNLMLALPDASTDFWEYFGYAYYLDPLKYVLVKIVGIYRTKHIMQGKYHNRRYPARAEEPPT